MDSYDGFVYIVRDTESGTLLKVGKGRGPLDTLADGRLAVYARAGDRLGGALAVDLWRVPYRSEGAIERELRASLDQAGYDLPWDNTIVPGSGGMGRLGRRGPGTPWVKPPSDLLDFGWHWSDDGILMDGGDPPSPVPQITPRFPG